MTFDELIKANILVIGDGYRAKNEELGGNGVLFLRAGHVADGTIDFAGVEQFHERLTDVVAPKMAKAGDAVVTTKGNSTGRVTFIREGLPAFVYSPHLSYWRSLDHEQLLPRFLYYWSRGEEFGVQLRGMSLSTDMAPYLSLRDQRRLEMTVPPIGRQKMVAGLLGAIDDKIDSNRRMNATLEALARAVFQAWFIDFEPVRAKAAGAKAFPMMPREVFDASPSGFTESSMGSIPKGWLLGTVRRLTERIENGGTPKRQVAEYWAPGEIPWLTSGEVRKGFVVVTENFISKTGLENSSAKMWSPFTTVVALYGATAGYASLIGTELSANQACCALIPKVDAASFIYLLVSSAITHYQQQTRGSAQQNLSQSIVADLPTVIPPSTVLSAFEKLARPWLERCIHNMQQSITLARLRDTLLPKLMSGEVNVRP